MSQRTDLVRNSLPEQLILEAAEETADGIVLRVRKAAAALPGLFRIPLDQIKYAVLERNGAITVIKKEK